MVADVSGLTQMNFGLGNLNLILSDILHYDLEQARCLFHKTQFYCGTGIFSVPKQVIDGARSEYDPNLILLIPNYPINKTESCPNIHIQCKIVS